MPSRCASCLAGGKLPVGGPLHEFDEFDFGGVGPLAQAGASGLVRLLATLPAIPTRACLEFVPEHFETGEARQQAARARRGIFRNPVGVPASGSALKAANAERSARHFSPATAGIVDDVARPQVRQRRLQRRRSALEFRKFFDIDIERVEKQPAVRRIGTAIAGPVVEQRMQRIEADAVGAEMMRQARSGPRGR